MAELKAAGKTIREVAVELGLSKSTVGRLFKEIETVPTCPTVPRVPAALMRRKGLLPEEWELSQCLFGEHLLSLYPDRTVALVESEKTAVICAGFIPEYVWLATDQSRVRNLACKSSFFSLSQAGSFQALTGIRIESIYV